MNNPIFNQKALKQISSWTGHRSPSNFTAMLYLLVALVDLWLALSYFTRCFPLSVGFAGLGLLFTLLGLYFWRE